MNKPRPPIERLLERLNSLEEALAQTNAKVAAAEQRAVQAEAEAASLRDATGNLAAAVVNPNPISRRSLFTKAAAVGAAGVAGSLLLNRPKDAYAIFTWQGGAANTADLTTSVTAVSGFTNNAILRLDANQGANPTVSTDGLQSTASGGFSGVAAYGGNRGGVAYYGNGGPGLAGASGWQAGPAIRVGSGTNYAGGGGFSYVAELYGSGGSDNTAFGSGIFCYMAGSGYSWFIGGGGAGTTGTNHVNGGPALYAYGGPGATALQAIGGGNFDNPSIGAHGVRGAGNALGVGGYFSGGRAQVQLIPGGGVGAPTTLQHFRGDLYMDANEVIWVCIANGTPGVFAPLQPGGINNALFTAVSTLQYTFVGSNGVTWADMDPINLILTINPKYNCQAILTASADLWTAASGYNQDIGIAVSGGAYPTVAGQPEGWKESGGSAGTYSPNAAHVDTVVPLAAGTAYTVKLVWKTNKPAAGKMIAAGAGPIGGKFSPTRLTAWLVPTNPGGTIPRTPAKPFVHDIPKLVMPAADAHGRKLG